MNRIEELRALEQSAWQSRQNSTFAPLYRTVEEVARDQAAGRALPDLLAVVGAGQEAEAQMARLLRLDFWQFLPEPLYNDFKAARDNTRARLARLQGDKEG